MSHFHTFAAVLSPTIGTGDIAGVARVTTAAFSSTLAVFSELTVSVGLMLLAFSTIISWSCYGDRWFQCLFGNGAVLPYRVVYALLAPIGAVAHLDLVWNLSDIANAVRGCRTSWRCSR